MITNTPGARLRRAWVDGPVAVPGVFNCLAARMAKRAGFRAVYLSGGALSAASGVPDVGILTQSEFLDEARRLAAATDLPLLCDADTGFGEAVNAERTVRLMGQAGVAGVHLEDQVLPKRCGHLSGKQLVEPAEMAAKLRAAAAGKTDPDFVLIARTDARGVNGFDDVVARAELYLSSGADVIFPEALQSEDEFAEFARRVKAPLLANMTEFGKSPAIPRPRLKELGYEIALYPLTAFRVAMKAAQEAYVQLAAGDDQQRLLDGMLTRATLYDLLDYDDFQARDRAFFGPRED